MGGNAPERIALRRAIALGFNSDEFIKVFYGGQGLPANQLLPPGTSGHDPKLPPKSAYDPAAARALLDRFGYKDRDGDGFRETPDGKPLSLVQSSMPDSLSREGDTLWLKNMTAIGLKMTINTQQFNDLLRQSKAGQLMMFNLGYRASEPSGYSLLSTLWGKSPPDIDLARFRNADYDAAFELYLRTPDGPERAGARAQDVRRGQRVRADRDAGLSGGQRVRAAVAARLLPVAVRLHVEVHGHRSRAEERRGQVKAPTRSALPKSITCRPCRSGARAGAESATACGGATSRSAVSAANARASVPGSGTAGLTEVIPLSVQHRT